MRTTILLALLASFCFAGGQGEGFSSHLAKVVSKMDKDGVDTLKFNNQRMLIIIKKINLDSAAIESYARGLDKDSIKNSGSSQPILPSEQEISIPPIDPSQVKGYQNSGEWEW